MELQKNENDAKDKLYPQVPTVTCISPNLIVRGAPYDITIFVEEDSTDSTIKNESPILIKVSLKSISNVGTNAGTSVVMATGMVTISPGHHDTIHLLDEYMQLQLNRPCYQLLVQAFNQGHLDQGSPSWEDTRLLNVSTHDYSVFIHTDKPIYKPGESVQFRLILLDRQTKLLQPGHEPSSVDLNLFDPQYNLIKIWKNVSFTRGLFKNEFNLSSEPLMGAWTLTARIIQKLHNEGEGQRSNSLDGQANHQDPDTVDINIDQRQLSGYNNDNENDYPDLNTPFLSKDNQAPISNADFTLKTYSTTFVVDKYVLPKFKVTVNIPVKYVLIGNSVVPVEVTALYTYGKGVKGECIILATLRSQNKYTNPPLPITTPLNSDDGHIVVQVPLNHLPAPESLWRDSELDLEVIVRESVTGLEQKVNGRVKTHVTPHYIKKKYEWVSSSSSAPPDCLKWTWTILNRQDDSPILDLKGAVDIRYSLYDPYTFYDQNGDTNKSCLCSFLPKSSPIKPDGTFELTLSRQTAEKIHTILLTYEKASESTNVYIPTYASHENLEQPGIKLDPIIVRLNTEMKVTLTTKYPIKSVNYLIVEPKYRSILSSGRIDRKMAGKSITFEIYCPPSTPQHATLILYYFQQTGGWAEEIIAESTTFYTKSESSDAGIEEDKNILRMSLFTHNFVPGQTVDINLKTHGQGITMVALKALDKSVLLLNKEDQDLDRMVTRNLIEKDAEFTVENANYSPGSYPYWIHNALNVFRKRGLLMMTNAKFGNTNEPDLIPRRSMGSMLYQQGMGSMLYQQGMESMLYQQQGMGKILGGNGTSYMRERSYFPETWIWDEIEIENGNGVFRKVAPDTLTSWVLSGYAIHEKFGLVFVQNPIELTTFQPFFLTLNLPYSVVRGDLLTIQVLIHNYVPDLLTPSSVQVVLQNAAKEFQIIGTDHDKCDDNEGEMNDYGMRKMVECLPNSVTSVTFKVIPLHLGFIVIKVKAWVNGHDGDALKQMLRVKPAGEQRQKSVSALLILRYDDGQQQENKVALTPIFPVHRVEGADRVTLTVISDLLGPSIQNLDNLIRLPVGCGEQLMLNFVANIVVLEYMMSSGGLTTEIKSKASGYLESGYQQELRYRHLDSSFSAFGAGYGGKCKAGSTWLTALVCRYFIKATSFITIDEKVICGALTFLKSMQNEETGGFREENKVYETHMQGGSASSEVALTTFVLLTFLEGQKWAAGTKMAKKKDENEYIKVIERGLGFITSKMEEKFNEENGGDLYCLILSCYALHCCGDPRRDKYFDEMRKSASSCDDGLICWNTGTSMGNLLKMVDVEMTGYALLVYVMRNLVVESVPIGKWLLKQRNPTGGFSSTQDTAVALTALAKFAKVAKDDIPDLNVNVTVTTTDGLKHEDELMIQVNEENSMVLQEFQLSPLTRNLQCEAIGRGPVLLQLNWSYFVLNDHVEEPAFIIEVKAEKKTDEFLILDVSTRFVHLAEKSNMVIIEVNLPSGYVVDEEYLKREVECVSEYRRYEVKEMGCQLHLYLDSLVGLSTEGSPCRFKMVAIKRFDVETTAQAHITAYDYYEPSRRATVFYSVSKENWAFGW